jgi:cyanobactin biosynthesis protein (PatB/AcyB/McaB family)
MGLPPQAPPVRRPEVIAPHRCVETEHGSGDQLIHIRMRLMHGANFNDPQHYEHPTYGRMRVSIGGR